MTTSCTYNDHAYYYSPENTNTECNRITCAIRNICSQPLVHIQWSCTFSVTVSMWQPNISNIFNLSESCPISTVLLRKGYYLHRQDPLLSLSSPTAVGIFILPQPHTYLEYPQSSCSKRVSLEVRQPISIQKIPQVEHSIQKEPSQGILRIRVAHQGRP